MELPIREDCLPNRANRQPRKPPTAQTFNSKPPTGNHEPLRGTNMRVHVQMRHARAVIPGIGRRNVHTWLMGICTPN